MNAKNRSQAKKSQKSSRKSNNPLSKKACNNRSMIWVKKHSSKSAKGSKKHMVRGSCRRSPRRA